MAFIPIEFQPGINKEGTDYSAEGGWIDSDKIRFRKGYVERIGGWISSTSNTFLGVCRALHTWSDLISAIRIGVGTHLKYYLNEGGVYYDITPIRRSVTLGTDPLTSDAAASGVITVTDSGHGAKVGDYVTLSGATAFDGLTTGDLNKEHVITEVTSSTAYKVDTGGSASVGSVSGGGSSVDADYQINIGLVDWVAGTGWGAGEYSESGRGWGESSAFVAGGEQIRLWTHDNYGEDLVICPRGGKIYYWDKTGGTGARAVDIGTLGGASDTPTICNIVAVTENRQVMAYGVNDLGSGNIDPMLIRWSDEEDVAMWTPDVTNGSGGYRLGKGSLIVAVQKGRQENLIWTDAAIYSQRLGGEFLWTHSLLTQNVSIMGPNASIMVDQVMYWMDRGNFYRYTGRVEILPCSLLSSVFDDFNYDQAWKVVVGRNSEYGEITWFYPSSGSSENDKYITYNYKEDVWYGGTMERTAWEESRLSNKPIAVDTNGKMYNHEVGDSDDGQDMTCYAESADMDLKEGDEFWFVTRLIPDLHLESGSEVTFTIKGRDFPFSSKESLVSFSSDGMTYKNNIRLRARQIAIRVESSGQKSKWRLGKLRLDARLDGRRRIA